MANDNFNGGKRVPMTPEIASLPFDFDESVLDGLIEELGAEFRARGFLPSDSVGQDPIASANAFKPSSTTKDFLNRK